MAAAAPKRAVRLAELLAHRMQIHAIATRHGVHNVRVFGSVARDTATAPRPAPDRPASSRNRASS